VLSAMGRQALPLMDEATLNFILTPPVKGLVLMAISHSGESRFALKAAKEGRRAGVPVIGMSNEPGSELAVSVDVYVPTQTVERAEGSFSIAPRVCQLAVLDRLVTMLRQSDDEPPPARRKAPPRKPAK
jgi:DNA-binding MurR/RpiR family transcriptional regulator